MRNKATSKVEVGDIIKHKAFMDVAVQVTYIVTYSDRVTITGVWYNLGQTKSFEIRTDDHPQGIMCNFDITKKNLANWFRCEEPTAKFLREAAWESIA